MESTRKASPPASPRGVTRSTPGSAGVSFHSSQHPAHPVMEVLDVDEIRGPSSKMTRTENPIAAATPVEEMDNERFPTGAMGMATPPAGTTAGITFEYSKLEDMPEKMKKKLQEIDTDNSGDISLEELVALAQQHRRLQWVVLGLAIAIAVLLAGIFGVSWAAAILAQDTDTVDASMTIKGSSTIVRTAEAEETWNLAYAPLLDGQALSNVKQLSLSGLNDITGNSDPAPPPEYALRVMSAVPVNETTTEFHGAQSKVRVHMGEVFIMDVPGYTGRTFRACGTAISNAFEVETANFYASLEVKANNLGFVTRRQSGC